MLFVALSLALALSAAASDRPPPHNCFLRLTNDHVSRTYIYHDTAQSAAKCKAKAARFAEESNLASMRDEVRVLYHEVEYQKAIIAKVDLKG